MLLILLIQQRQFAQDGHICEVRARMVNTGYCSHRFLVPAAYPMHGEPPQDHRGWTRRPQRGAKHGRSVGAFANVRHLTRGRGEHDRGGVRTQDGNKLTGGQALYSRGFHMLLGSAWFSRANLHSQFSRAFLG